MADVSSLAALLSGGGDGMSTDPGMLAAQPQLKLAQAMTQQGIDTSPASPWQALARLAQAGAGQYIQGNTLSDLGKAYSQSAEGLAGALEKSSPGHPLVAALRSPDPNVRMMAVKQAGEALTQLPQQAERRRENERDFAFRQQEAGRAQSNADRSFKQQQEQFNKPTFGDIGPDPQTMLPAKGFIQPTTRTVQPYKPQPTSAGPGGEPVRPKSKAERDALPVGAQYIAPDGSVRVRE